MDEHLARLERIYPGGRYVKIPKYIPDAWKGREYDSNFDTKAAINKWKTSPLNYDDAQEAVEEGYRVGWIVPEGYVIVDIDNNDHPQTQEYLERLLKKFEVNYNFNYTSKGIHLLFQDHGKMIKSDSRYKCAINLVVDTRANLTGYIVLPPNDPHREWGTWNDFVENIPYFLTPILKDTTPSFIGLSEGDGRNNALFKWRTKLEQTHKLTDSEIERSIKIINENLFDTAMPNSELFKTVLREHEKKVKVKSLDDKNMYNEAADSILETHDIIARSDYFYIFNGSYYKPVDSTEIERIIHYEVSPNVSQAGRKEILSFMKIKAQVPIEEFDKEWHKIAVKNGVINLITGELTPATKSDINTIYLPYNYDSDPPESPRIDEFMKEICDGDFIKMEFLYQIAGYCLLKKNVFEKFFIFKGEGSTGKSTFMNLLHRMCGGDANCSHTGLAEFDKDYYLASTVSKLLNIDDDVVDGKLLENTGRFKSIISGNIISVRQIYREVMSFVPFLTCIFSCNRLPRIMDKTSGLYRRMILVELNHKVSKPDPLFMSKVTDQDIEYLLFKAVNGVKTALEEGRFRISTSEEELLNLFKRRQSPLNEWLYEMQLTLNEVHEVHTLTLYNQFIDWCNENGYNKLMNAFTFKEDMCVLYDVELDFANPSTEGATSNKQVFVKRGEFDPEYTPFGKR